MLGSQHPFIHCVGALENSPHQLVISGPERSLKLL